jgi:hypothetical protein
MICYKDRTYCNAGILCKDNGNCDRVMQQHEIVQARKLNLPVAYMDFTRAPCFVPFFSKSEAKRRDTLVGKRKKSKAKV